MAALCSRWGPLWPAGRTDAAIATLTAAVAAGSPDRATLRLRLATLHFEHGNAPAAVTGLDDAVAGDHDTATRTGIIATLYGRPDAAARHLHRSPEPDAAIRLLGGNAALAAGQPEQAANDIDLAYRQSTRPAERLCAQERRISVARQTGRLGELADAWLADRNLPAERVLPLAAVLRELNRTSDLLA